MAPPALTIVIPATDRPPTLGRAVAAVEGSLPPGGEVLVVTEARAPGPAAARNEGALRARGDVIVFVDADVVVAPDALARIAARMEVDPGLGAVFGTYDDAPEARGTVSRFRNLLHHHIHVSGAGPARTFWAGLGAVRREVFQRAGGFDQDRYPAAAIEDIELGARLSAAGTRIELDPEVRGKHLKRWTLRSMIVTDFARRGIPWTLLQLERREPAGTLNLATGQRLAACAAGVALAGALGRRPLLVLAGVSGVVTANSGFYALLAKRGGPRMVLAGVPLHLAHYGAALASVPAALVAHAAGFTEGGRRR